MPTDSVNVTVCPQKVQLSYCDVVPNTIQVHKGAEQLTTDRGIGNLFPHSYMIQCHQACFDARMNYTTGELTLSIHEDLLPMIVDVTYDYEKVDKPDSKWGNGEAGWAIKRLDGSVELVEPAEQILVPGAPGWENLTPAQKEWCTISYQRSKRISEENKRKAK